MTTTAYGVIGRPTLPVCMLVALVAFAASCSRQPDPPAIELRTVSMNSASVAGELFVDGVFVAHTMQPLDTEGKATSLGVPPGDYGGTLEHQGKGGWVIHLTGESDTEPGVSIRMSTGRELTQGVLTLGDTVKNRRDSIRSRKPRSFSEGLVKAFYGDGPQDEQRSREVEVKIVEFPGPTVFTNERMSLRYEGEGRWTASTAKDKEYLEESRDGGYIVLKNASTRREIRIPLQGGKLASKRNPSSSNWITRGGAPVFERTH